MTSFDELSTMDLHVETQGDGLPRIWWHNGTPGQAARGKAPATPDLPGTFYTKAADFDGELGPPWEAEERFKGEPGYAAETLRILPIITRAQWYLQSGQDSPKIWLAKYEEGARRLTEVLCFVEGIEGPVVLSLKGMASRAVAAPRSKGNKEGGIFAQFRAAVIAPAEGILKKRLPDYTFWVPISTLRGRKGEVEFTDTGKGATVTLPALALPAGLEGRDLLNGLYAGKATIAAASEAWEQYQDWAKEVRGNAPVEPEEDAAGRNVPQALSPEDFESSMHPDDVL